MMTGIVIGYNSTGSSTSRLRARTSMAANSVPTAAKPSVPSASRATSSSGMLNSGAWNISATIGTISTSTKPEQHEDAQQLARVDRRPVAGREHQRVQRLVGALALERPPQGQRARERDGDPQDARRHVVHGPALADEAEREHQDARGREEGRRVDDLAAAHLDRQVLAHDEPRHAHEASPRGRSPRAPPPSPARGRARAGPSRRPARCRSPARRAGTPPGRARRRSRRGRAS